MSDKLYEMIQDEIKATIDTSRGSRGRWLRSRSAAANISK